jgi:hypothetical protein
VFHHKMKSLTTVFIHMRIHKMIYIMLSISSKNCVSRIHFWTGLTLCLRNGSFLGFVLSSHFSSFFCFYFCVVLPVTVWVWTWQLPVPFINMGCIMDLEIAKETLKKAIGPVIGFCCQYMLMVPTNRTCYHRLFLLFNYIFEPV